MLRKDTRVSSRTGARVCLKPWTSPRWATRFVWASGKKKGRARRPFESCYKGKLLAAAGRQVLVHNLRIVAFAGPGDAAAVGDSRQSQRAATDGRVGFAAEGSLDLTVRGAVRTRTH